MDVSVVRQGAALAAVALSALACRGDRTPARDSTVPASHPASATGSSTADSCPRTGHWIPCQVRRRLEQSGLAPRDTSLDDLPRLGPSTSMYVVGTNGLAVYLYADSTARRQAAAGLDPARFIAPSAALTMRHEATAIQNDNLLAILYSQRDQQRERVSDALMAGPPQP
jgi:hypothetical protein